MAQGQYYYFNIVTYCREELVERVQREKWQYIEWICWCEHWHDWLDPENHDDTKLKDRHIHVVIRTHTQHSRKVILNWFYDPDYHQNTFVDACERPVGACRYLLHLDDPKKYQYLKTELRCSGLDYWSYITQADESVDPYREMWRDVKRGLAVDSMIDKYGQLYIRNAHLLSKIRDVYALEESEIRREQEQLQEVFQNDYCDCMFGENTES